MALTHGQRRFGWLTVSLLGALCARGVAAPLDRAQELFSHGVEAARQDRWNEARAAFEQAYELSPRSVVLINLAGAQANTQRLKEAAANYRRVLDDPSPEAASFRSAAAGVLPSLEARIPRIRLHASGVRPDDVVEIDGQAVPLDSLDAPHLLDPGAHVITVARSGAQRARVTVSLEEGESHDVSLTVTPDSPPPLPDRLAASSAPGLDLTASDTGPTAARSHGSWWRSPWLWAAVVATAAAAAVVTTVVIIGNRNQNEPFSGNVGSGRIYLP